MENKLPESIRSGIFAGMCCGCRLISSDALVISKLVRNDDKRWWDYVADWNPCNIEFHKPDYLVEYEPDPRVYKMGDRFVAHPVVIDQLKRGIDHARQ